MKYFISIILFVVQTAYSQRAFQPKTIPTPNASSFQRFEEIPIDYQTGIPDISIPIYTLQSKSIKVPISIKYHAAGIKPNIYPGWVGLNWTLSTGGTITRVVNSIPDDADNFVPDAPQYNENLGYYFNYSILDNDNWYDISIVETSDLRFDTEPDEFRFQVNGLTGTFYLDHMGIWQVESEQEVKVIFDNDNLKDINYNYNYPFTHGYMFYKFTLLSDKNSNIYG